MSLKRVSPSEAAKFAAASPAVDAATLHFVQQMLDAVDQRGAAAVRELSLKYGDLKDASEPLLLPPAALAEAFNKLPADQQQLLHRVADRIRAFAVCSAVLLALSFLIVLAAGTAQLLAGL
jgi:histidinol dehydrogenase